MCYLERFYYGELEVGFPSILDLHNILFTNARDHISTSLMERILFQEMKGSNNEQNLSSQGIVG